MSNDKFKNSTTKTIGKFETIQEIKLTPVLGSSYCQFSVIENKLKIMYENQEKILLAIKLLSKQNEK
jgi:hypothetical protein